MEIYNKKEFSSVILNLYNFNNSIEKININKEPLEKILKRIDKKGSFWIICNPIYNKLGLDLSIYELIEHLFTKGWYLRNIIIWFIPSKDTKFNRLTNRYSYLFFLVKDYKNYIFNKDLIREKHIWEGIEWGKRQDRYNPKGKDPGNVWLMTEDDGKGNITKHLSLSLLDVINRITLLTKQEDKEFAILSDNLLDYPNFIKIPLSNIVELSKDNRDIVNIINSTKINSKNIKLFYKIINRTSENMFDIKNNEVDLIVTSPPYWDMKNYENGNQIGYSEKYEKYLSRINKVWEECFRVLKDSGSFWLNINTKIYNNSLKLIHYDFYKQMIKIGFKLWDIVIWHKSVSGPAPNNNLTDKFEYVLIFYKKPGFYFNFDFEKSKIDYRIPKLKDMGNVWNINRFWGSIGKNYPHPAMFPDELIDRIINFTTIEGDTVLDPFLGSGTTLVVSKKNRRSCVGYEINKDYFKILERRLFEENLENLFNLEEQVQFIN